MKAERTGILVVDDDPDMCCNMSDILNDLGYRVDTAREGRTALLLLEQRGYDIALLDWKMPGMDGLALSREVRKRRPETVALLITGFPNELLREQARAAGIRHILPKPVHVPRLLAEIEKTIAG